MDEPKSKPNVNPIPEGFHTVTPFLLTENTEELIKFIKNAFDGKENYVMRSDDGIIRHATIKIGNSLIMISHGTELYGSGAAMLHLYVENSDAVYQQALKAGGISLREPVNEFYGDRSAGVKDKWGNQWWIATHIEDVGDEEIRKREKEFREKEGLK